MSPVRPRAASAAREPEEPVLEEVEESLEVDDLLLLDPEDVAVKEVEGFTSGVRVVDIAFSKEYLNEYYDAVRERANGELVMRAYIFTQDMVAVRALVAVSADVDTESAGFSRIMEMWRETYGLTFSKIQVEFIIGTMLPLRELGDFEG